MSIQAPFNQKASQDASTANSPVKKWLLGSYALGLSVALSLTTITSPADAATLRLGDVNVQIDTTVSAGVSIRAEDRETALLPARNGGPKDNTPGFDPFLGTLITNSVVPAGTDCGTSANPSAYAQNALPGQAAAFPSRCMFGQLAFDTFMTGGTELYNYDASINTDDGRLNFDNGDLTGGTVKITSDIEADIGNVRFFTRVNGFYDAVLADSSSYERSPLLDRSDSIVIRDAELLDFYFDYDTDIAGRPLLVRVGRQVINWGEATFILGGNSVFNSIDVNAIRRPGAEIKEALLPIEAIYGSFALTEDINIEAYIGGWDDYKIDVGGTPFANSDSFEGGSAGNGGGAEETLGRFYVGSGAYSGSGKRDCNAHNSTNVATAAYGTLFNDVFGECQAGSAVDIYTPNAAGNVEASRQAIANTVADGRREGGYTLYDTDYLARGVDDDPRDIGDTDNYGLAVRWYAENLNSTEFGAYYQKYTSRIPYAASIARTPVAGPNVTTPTSGFFLRGFTAAGCKGTYGATGGFVSSAAAVTIYPDDPTGIGAAEREFFEAEVARFDATPATATIIQAATTNYNTDATVMATSAQTTAMDIRNALAAGLALPQSDTGTGSLAAGGVIGCVSILAQTGTAALALPTGASTIATRYQTEIFGEYPEDIEVYGLSAATTLLGWGVQGEIAYRPDMPLALDGDSISIVALSASCAWENFNAVAAQLYAGQTIESTCGDFDEVFHGYVREEVFNVDIGTTATFTRSNPVISALQADLGILLTEIGYVHMPDADEYKQDNPNLTRTPRLANQCTSGSDLPLGGVFSLDPRTADECRPTKDSYGIVLFGQLQYNNAFGSAWGLRPTLAYRRGMEGRSPSPAGSFIEDNESLNLSVTADYQSEWSVSLGYTAFDGDVLYNRNIDRDFYSLSGSYAF